MVIAPKNDFILLASFAFIGIVSSYGPHHPKGPHSHYRPQTDSNFMKDTKLLQDEAHIKEDLSNLVLNPDTDKMSPAELEFYYFKVHDFDNNTKLDGLEILQALQHSLHDEKNDMELQKYIDLIDRVFQEDDLDRDGYLSYAEYIVGREREKKG